jgi:plasmid stability protein
MPTLTIKDVPEPLAQALRERASRHHRSLQGELMAIVEEAARETGERPALKTSAKAGDAEALRLGHRSIEQIAAEMRSAGVRPVEGQPLAVDILRAERDAR